MSAEPQSLDWHKPTDALWVAAPHPDVIYAIRAEGATAHAVWIVELDTRALNRLGDADSLEDAKRDAAMNWEDIKDVQ